MIIKGDTAIDFLKISSDVDIAADKYVVRIGSVEKVFEGEEAVLPITISLTSEETESLEPINTVYITRYEGDAISTFYGYGIVKTTTAPVNSCTEFPEQEEIILTTGEAEQKEEIILTLNSTVTVESVNGETGAVVITADSLGLGNVDNTSDIDKPISEATQSAIDLKADKSTVEEELALKADKSDTYTKSDVDTNISEAIDNLDSSIKAELESYSTTEEMELAITSAIEPIEESLTETQTDVLNQGLAIETNEKAITDINTNIDSIGENIEKIDADIEEINTNLDLKLNSADLPTTVSSFTNDSGYITSTALEPYSTTVEMNSAISSAVSSVYKYKGSVDSFDDLPTTGLTIGDVYNVEDTGDNYAWTGTDWDSLAGTVDLSAYSTTAQMNTAISNATSPLSTSINTLDSNVSDLDTKVDLKANSSDLSTVATSGSYSDLSNKPALNGTTLTSSSLLKTINSQSLLGDGDITAVGPTGADGTTFTPSVSDEGVISWTNDGGLVNPDSVDITGPQGEQGVAGTNGTDGADGLTTDIVLNGTTYTQVSGTITLPTVTIPADLVSYATISYVDTAISGIQASITINYLD